MNLAIEVVGSLKNVDLLSNVGKPIDYYPQVTKITEVRKSIRSMKWENICLEEIGNVTAYLAVHHSTEYNSFWNKGVMEIREVLLPSIDNQLLHLKHNKIIDERISEAIRFDMINIVMAISYEHFVSSKFYNKMYKIYLDGHLPCGWRGEYPMGEIEVY
jgi:hypothetical protein